MLLTLAVILIILWLLGLITSYTLGGWLRILAQNFSGDLIDSA